MDFIRKENTVTIVSDKKNIILKPNSILIDDFVISCAGEYEKSGFLFHVRENDGIFYAHFRIEGEWIGYISSIPTDLDTKILDFFGQLDILLAPFSKSEKKLLEQLEPRMLISFSDASQELATLFASEIPASTSYKLKSADINTDKTTIVPLAA